MTVLMSVRLPGNQAGQQFQAEFGDYRPLPDGQASGNPLKPAETLTTGLPGLPPPKGGYDLGGHPAFRCD